MRERRFKNSNREWWDSGLYDKSITWVSPYFHKEHMTIMDRILGKSDEPVSDRMIGKIIKLSPDGWGFITSKEKEFTRIFFHWTSLTQNTLNFKELAPGMKVEFRIVEVPERGWRALNITVIEDDVDD